MKMASLLLTAAMLYAAFLFRMSVSAEYGVEKVFSFEKCKGKVVMMRFFKDQEVYLSCDDHGFEFGHGTIQFFEMDETGKWTMRNSSQESKYRPRMNDTGHFIFRCEAEPRPGSPKLAYVKCFIIHIQARGCIFPPEGYEGLTSDECKEDTCVPQGTSCNLRCRNSKLDTHGPPFTVCLTNSTFSFLPSCREADEPENFSCTQSDQRGGWYLLVTLLFIVGLLIGFLVCYAGVIWYFKKYNRIPWQQSPKKDRNMPDQQHLKPNQ